VQRDKLKLWVLSPRKRPRAVRTSFSVVTAPSRNVRCVDGTGSHEKTSIRILTLVSQTTDVFWLRPRTNSGAMPGKDDEATVRSQNVRCGDGTGSHVKNEHQDPDAPVIRKFYPGEAVWFVVGTLGHFGAA
jgi:hypothetical protein